MKKPVLSPDRWKKVQTLVEGGASIAEVAEKFGVRSNAIHQRAHRFKWATPKRLVQEVLIEEAKSKAKGMSVEEAKAIISGDEVAHLTNATAKLAELREEMPPIIAENLAGKIKRSLVSLGDPKNYKELSSAVSMLSTMLGLNKQGGGAQISIGMQWNSSTPSSPSMTCTPTSSPGPSPSPCP